MPEISSSPCLFRQRLDEYKRENVHDENFCDPTAERISHWSHPHISIDRVKRIMSGTAPHEWEGRSIAGAIGRKFLKMRLEEIFGEVIWPNSAAKISKSAGAIADDGQVYGEEFQIETPWMMRERFEAEKAQRRRARDSRPKTIRLRS